MSALSFNARQIYLPKLHNCFTFVMLNNCINLKTDGFLQYYGFMRLHRKLVYIVITLVSVGRNLIILHLLQQIMRAVLPTKFILFICLGSP